MLDIRLTDRFVPDDEHVISIFSFVKGSNSQRRYSTFETAQKEFIGDGLQPK
jgi:hypothetical protein